MAKTTGRIPISHNPKKMLTMAAKVYKKHQDEGTSSPLLILDGTDWKVIGPTIEQALALHNEAEMHKKRMETAYRERDLLTADISKGLKASRNLLKAINKDNPRRLANWGFEVVDSVKKAKVKKSETDL